jgi:serine-aspartate repeat-containing protein C/D/E
VGLLDRIARLVRRYRTVERPRTEADDYRRCRFETMEGRRLLNADPIRFGGTYVEEDSGSDSHGDTFEITFLGGAPGTQLTRVEINGDQSEPGFGDDDVFFDSKSSGLGADQPFDFQILSLQTKDPTASVSANVQDGTTLLVLNFDKFQAGDKFVFSIDVEEVELFDPKETDLAKINEGMDPITSGVEFQSSKLTGFFQAPHYFDASGTSEYLNLYDNQLAGKGLNLAADNAGGKRDRSAGTALQLVQSPLPIAIAGTVFVEKNLDLKQDAGEAGLSNVEISLWQKQGDAYVFTGHTTRTDSNGDYEFGTGLGMLPGTYQVRETQPAGLFSVGAIPGTVDGQTSGVTVAGNRDILTDIEIPLGDQRSINNDFSEAEPAGISGFVYHDRSNEGLRAPGEEGLAGVSVQVVPVNTIVPQNTVTVQTDVNGHYEAPNLSPGTYRIVEVSQPTGYFDGLDTPGQVDGASVGNAVNPGDRLDNIQLLGGQVGMEYNFGELAPASIRGQVNLTDKDGNCFMPGVPARPIENVLMRLLDAQGQQVAETRTNADGEYEFTGLRPGTYTVVEVTPAGLIDGEELVGSVGADTRGQLNGNDRMSGIVLGPDQHGVGYNFCEHEPSTISGFVYHDANDNGQREPGEGPVNGVSIELFDQDGKKVGTTTTNSDGFYEFVQLSAGRYQIVEKQPNGWYDGKDTAGTVDGANVGVAGNDQLSEVQIGWGQTGSDYNFGELLPGSIAGRIHLDTNGNCVFDPGELPLGGVTVQLLDSTGKVIGTTQTNDGGQYEFTNLAPGTYGVRELQPNGVFHGGQLAGSAGGNDSQTDVITGIAVGSGQTLVDYNFCEEPPSTLSGLVFSDPNGDCVFNPGDTPLSNVTIQLLNAQGNVIATTLTDANGRYKFEGLAKGTYSVRELQPTGLFHGGQTAGSNGGIDTLSDLISQISIGAGQNLVDYNFCETPPSTLAGMVFVDPNGDCTFNSGDSPLSNVTIQLLDAQGNVVQTTLTDADGKYKFEGLAPGTYSVRELQPAGLFHGGQTAGSNGGIDTLSDLISQISVGAGQDLVDYNFCETPPSSLSGLVFLDPNGDCTFNPGDTPLENVQIQLLDANGNVVGTTSTDADGRYKFEGLAPGNYSVRESQPAGYYHGGQTPGSGGGATPQADLISEILISGGQDLIDYNFCELSPSSLSGIIFADPNGDCVQNGGEIGLSNVTVQLLNAQNEIVATKLTDNEGRYKFENLAPGVYSVRELQPASHFNGGHQAGSGGGDASTISARRRPPSCLVLCSRTALPL